MSRAIGVAAAVAVLAGCLLAGAPAAARAARAVRIYYDAVDVFPSAWPRRAGTNWTVLSIRPRPGPLLSGSLNPQLDALIDTAPPHSRLTIWHEDAVGNNPLGYRGLVRNPAVYRAMQAYMEHLVDGSNVRFGTIGCGPAGQAEQWYAPG